MRSVTSVPSHPGLLTAAASRSSNLKANSRHWTPPTPTGGAGVSIVGDMAV
jgi:hypothetical protein